MYRNRHLDYEVSDSEEEAGSDFVDHEEHSRTFLPKVVAGALLLAVAILASFSTYRAVMTGRGGQQEPRDGNLLKSTRIPDHEVNLRALQLPDSSTSVQSPSPSVAIETISAEEEEYSLEETTPDPLRPNEDLYDGNVCSSNEELYFGLCYKTCRELTGGTHPIRTTPWTCCRNHPCMLQNQKGNIGAKVLCNGYDVSGTGGCPHKPGACLKDEELFLGVCYKKCRLLTDGAFPYRLAAATCCKDNGWGCLDLRKDRTSPHFAVGGGNVDRSPMHPPSKHLTEAADSKQLRSVAAQVAKREPEAAPTFPGESLHDGCDEKEELYGGLCYKRCRDLTYGSHPIRTSSWTCCSGHPCGLMNEKGSLGTHVLCTGYDVAADGKCPHKPGVCFSNEELHFGMCYKRCGLLTDNEYPHRVAAATCCKSDGLSCLNFFKDKTRPGFAVGGGYGIANSSVPKKPHPPRRESTEESDEEESIADAADGSMWEKTMHMQ